MQIINYIPSEHLNDRIVVFGTGTWGTIIDWYLKQNNIEPYCYASVSGGGVYNQKKIISINELSEMYSADNVCILMAVGNSMEFVYSKLIETKIDRVYSAEVMLEQFDFMYIDFEDYIGQVYRDRKWYFCKFHQVFNRDKLSLFSLDVVLTEKCSLRCRGCSNLMQYYREPRNYNVDVIIDQIDILLKTIDTIWELRLIGGEPFINSDIYKIINKYGNHKKIKELVIYTNATLMVNEDCLNSLKNGNIRLEFSDYGTLSKKLNCWKEFCDSNNIKYLVKKYELWQDCGMLEKRNYSRDDLKRVYKECECKYIPTLLDGKIMACAYSAHAINLDAMCDEECKKDEIEIDSLPETTDVYEFLFRREYLAACDYCSGRNYHNATIPAHVQTKEPLSYEKRR